MSALVEKKAVDLGLLEEDDQFEEFPNQVCNVKDDNPDQNDVNVWEDNWDDDAVEDDFSVQLSTYSRRGPHSHSPPLRSPEPLAKKMCSRATPPPSPSRSSTNSNGNKAMNGHSNGNGHSVSASEPKTQEPEQQESSETTTSGRGGRRRTSRRGGAGDNSKDDSEPAAAPPTRSSKRLSRK